jgi:two-component system chemotaxis response regulator CheY
MYSSQCGFEWRSLSLNRATNPGRLTSTMNAKILLVDDSSILRKVMRKAVEQLGIDPAAVREASNGQEALDALREKPVDLVLLDLHMPIMGGFEFAQVKAADPTLRDIPFVVVSTESHVQRHIEMVELGALGILRKPFEPESLRRMVEAYLPPEFFGQEAKADLPGLESETLEILTANALERTAFVLSDPADVAPAKTFDRHARISYRSESELADIYLSASEGFLRELAASMLGIEEDDPSIVEELGAALSEMANIIAGEIVVALGGEEQRFTLGIPKIVPIESIPKGRAGSACGVSSLGENLQVSVFRRSVEVPNCDALRSSP